MGAQAIAAHCTCPHGCLLHVRTSFAVRMSAVPPTEADLSTKRGSLKKAETKEADGKADPAVVAVYKKAFADNGGDKAKLTEALHLEDTTAEDFADEAAFLKKFLHV